jgi:hypothetical protein
LRVVVVAVDRSHQLHKLRGLLREGALCDDARDRVDVGLVVHLAGASVTALICAWHDGVQTVWPAHSPYRMLV